MIVTVLVFRNPMITWGTMFGMAIMVMMWSMSLWWIVNGCLVSHGWTGTKDATDTN